MSEIKNMNGPKLCISHTQYKWWHKWRLLDMSGFKFWNGTYQTFGLAAAFGNICPIYTTISCWKYRNAYLVIPGITDEDGNVNK